MPSADRGLALTDAALVALAAGRPSAATVALLSRAALSRHRLQLRAIVAAAPTAARPYADLQRADPAAVRRELADPLFGAWAAGCLAALNRGESATDAGVAHLDEIVHRIATGRAPARTLRADHHGLTLSVRLEDTDPLRARLGLTPTGPLTGDQVAHWRACLSAAWRRLVDRHRPAAEVLAAVLEVIVPVAPDQPAEPAGQDRDAGRGISATAAGAFGAVAMSAPVDGVDLAVGLLHETWHSLLNAVQHLFDLHHDPDVLGYSPWRDDPRPVAGILHGAYAYLAVTRFWRTEARAAGASPLAAFEFARWREAVVEATTALLTPHPGEKGRTAAGVRFVTALRAEVLPWLDEPVPADVARLAAGANADHRLRWRLRTLTVDPDAVGRFAAAWRDGTAPPSELPAVRPAPGAGRALENSARLAAIRRHLVLGALQPGGAATAGDDAYLRGYYETARRAYLRAIPDDAAWTGLGLVSREPGLSDHLEIVAAVHRRILATGQSADPESVAAWMLRSSR